MKARKYNNISVEEAGVCIQNYKDNLCTGTEYIPAQRCATDSHAAFAIRTQMETPKKASQVHSH